MKLTDNTVVEMPAGNSKEEEMLRTVAEGRRDGQAGRSKEVLDYWSLCTLNDFMQVDQGSTLNIMIGQSYQRMKALGSNPQLRRSWTSSA